MADDRPGYSFTAETPPEIVRFFANKGIQPGFSWEDVEPEEHAVAFTVAKMAKTDMLEAARGRVMEAIETGQTFEQFQKSWRADPALSSWWGRAVQSDPVTGESAEVQLGSPRRLRTIYRTNLRQAQAAGQWERIERTKRALPFLEYRLGPSEVHRPAHAARAGTILPVDDPFWGEWMPPNGFGCKCWVRQVTRAEAERRGVSESPRLARTEYVNARTGEARMVPTGIDPGFDRNPGLMRQRAVEDLLEGRIADLPEPAARAALRDLATSWRVERVLGGAPGRVPVALLPPEVHEHVGSRFVNLTRASAEHLVDEKPDENRRLLIKGLAGLPEAEAGFVTYSTENLPAFKFRIPGVSGKRQKPDLMLIMWLDDDGHPYVRTTFPMAPKYWARQMSDVPDEDVILRRR
ncbi:phage head morphogenesis protein [Profundibacterium mesophilum]|uniref:Prophage MuSo2 F protein n=1 Tax=Profundibacterium mesophilum KAUST100406-0324 TaxID=1037889 RepID=A0A921NQ87_9RHOB|nr:phage minor head protein [Profundibacterium mesophilum]KAF0676746.1 putative Prophage MuSo2 F protein [Profundibacterium mesophilum KAUST100406-0324]